MQAPSYFGSSDRLHHLQHIHMKTCIKETNVSYDRVITESEAKTKIMWIYDSCSDIISRNTLQAHILSLL